MALDSTTKFIDACNAGSTIADIGAASVSHAMLSATHTDSTIGTCTRGDIITAQGASATWTRLAKGAQYKYLIMGADEVAWSTYTFNLGGNVATAGAVTLSGAYALTITLSNTTSVTLPVSGTLMASPFTAAGSMLYAGAASAYTPTELAKGTSGQFLKQGATNPAWATFGVGDIPLTTGSIIIGAASVGAALDVSGDTKILIGNGTTAAMQTIGGDATLANNGALTVTKLTIAGAAAGDILYYNGSAWVRLAKPVAGTQYLQGGTTPQWSTVSAGIASDLAASVTFQNTINDLTMTSTDQTVAGESIVIPNFNAGGTAHTFGFLNVAQAWSAVQTFTNEGIHILDTNASHDLVLKAGSDLTSDRILTITTGDAARTLSLGGDLTTAGAITHSGAFSIGITSQNNGTFAFADAAAYALTFPTGTVTLSTLTGTETLTNKTLTSVKIATADGIYDAGGDLYLKFVEDAAAKTYVKITSAATTVAPIISSDGDTANIGLNLYGKGTGKVTICDATTPTKQLAFELVGASAHVTTLTIAHTANRAITLPNADCTLVGKDTTDTLTNKTIDCDGTGNVVTNVNVDELDPIGDGACGVPIIYQKAVANLAAAGTNICGATNKKMRIIDAWFVATSADTGTIAVHAGQVGSVGASIVTAFTIPADDMQVTHCDEIDDFAWNLAVNTGLVAVGDGGASIDGVIFVKCIRID